MSKFCLSATAVMLCLFTTTASASIVLADFETGAFPSGWTVTDATGKSWEVDGATGTNPNISPDPAAGGLYFARSGEPNRHTGDLIGPAEEDVGVLTSTAYTVTYSTLQWLAVGHSGQQQLPPDGKNRFEILDINGVLKMAVDAPQWNGPPADGTAWATQSVNLLDYFQPGDTFYFQAVDKRNESTYAWLAFDNLTLTGDQLEIPTGVVPEATSFLIWSLIGLTFAAGGRKPLRSI